MNKKSKRIDRVQNVLIMALTVSSLFLLTRTPLFGTLSEESPWQLLSNLFADNASVSDSSQTTISTFSTPVQLLYTNDFSRFGRDSVTVLDGDFEEVSSLFSDAIGSASSPVSVSEEDFLSALQSSGIYVEFASELPLSLLNSALVSTDALPLDTAVRRILLSVGGTDSAKIYLQGENSRCTRYTTDLESAAIREFLNEQSGNGAYLSAQLSDEYNKLSPYTLILSDQATRYVLSVSNPLADSDFTELLRTAEFNPHTENRYTESSGATVIREGDSSLRIDAGGTVSYQGGNAEAGSLYFVDSQTSNPTAVEAVAAVQKLAATLLGSSGNASLYLSSITPTSSGYAVTLDYVVGGTPLCFSDGSHALSATIVSQSITAFSLHCRTYLLTDEIALLLPLQQAFAIAENSFEGTEPIVCYVDTGADTVLPGWIAT